MLLISENEIPSIENVERARVTSPAWYKDAVLHVQYGVSIREKESISVNYDYELAGRSDADSIYEAIKFICKNSSEFVVTWTLKEDHERVLRDSDFIQEAMRCFLEKEGLPTDIGFVDRLLRAQIDASAALVRHRKKERALKKDETLTKIKAEYEAVTDKRLVKIFCAKQGTENWKEIDGFNFKHLQYKLIHYEIQWDKVPRGTGTILSKISTFDECVDGLYVCMWDGGYLAKKPDDSFDVYKFCRISPDVPINDKWLKEKK